MPQRVRIVGASSPFPPAKLEAGVARLRAAGFDVDDRDVLQGTHAYLNGDDATRARLLEQALHSDVDVVWLARGGYGLTRIAQRLVLPARLPVVVGFSDVTALFARLHKEGRLRGAIHGPLATSVAGEPDQSLAHLVDVVAGGPGLPLPELRVLQGGGDVTAPLFAANLCVLSALCGTPLQPDLRGQLLVLEEISERPYRLDRMWTHLRLAGVLEKVHGLALGDFTECEEPGADFTSRDVLWTLAAETGLPCVAGLPIGHDAVNVPVALGTRVRLDGGTGTLSFLEPAVCMGATQSPAAS